MRPFIISRMNEAEAALKIQRCWRQRSVRSLIVVQARQEFEELCAEFHDAMPTWDSPILTRPKFSPPPAEVERLWIEHAIAQRLSVLKYQQFLAESARG
jgi:hypothetical protein